ncbi:hypothetical protein H9638_08300 [Arthrobacter sp. Sa2BUA2]|uniref:Uncharacterized protein n=1 Tax=Arthrobacter pullicola TaxID=2762224 RepID=A0ABR8YHZ0_9MICC|nr:hypothetical protein [Arthrobacter pullicola]MBD8043814.1 hypothetical protein [Arthrobacter pullicola]
MFKTMFAQTARTATPAGTGTLRAASPLGGSYVAVFDRPQIPVETSGGHYTATFGGPTVRCAAKPVDSYVAAFGTAGRPARGRRGSYTDAER